MLPKFYKKRKETKAHNTNKRESGTERKSEIFIEKLLFID